MYNQNPGQSEKKEREREKKKKEKIFEKLITENFPKIRDVKLQIQEAQITTSGINVK